MPQQRRWESVARAESILQTEKECFITGSKAQLDLHHVYAGNNRDQSDSWGCWVWLRHDIHMRLHDQDKEMDRMIRRICQERFEELYGHETFMKVFGKSYL